MSDNLFAEHVSKMRRSALEELVVSMEKDIRAVNKENANLVSLMYAIDDAVADIKEKRRANP